MTPVADASNGERVFVLDVPFEMRAVAAASGAQWFKGFGHAYVGASLPVALRPFAPREYSWMRWVEDDLAHRPPGTPNPDPSTGQYVLRPDQEEDVQTILDARALGSPEFLNGSDVGTGKTMVAIAATKRLPGVRNVLVVCPAPVMPAWRQAIADMGDGGKRWCVINYESTKRLLTVPPKAAAARTTRTKNLATVRDGISRVSWDVVISDESHWLGNPESQQSRTVEKVIEGAAKGRPAFSIRMSATAGSNPAQVSYLHRGLAWGSGEPIRAATTAEAYRDWCQARGMKVDIGGYGSRLTWERNEIDLVRMNLMIFQAEPRWALRRVPDWPDQQRIAMPIELTAEEMAAYEREWSDFHAAMREIERERARGAARGKGGAAAASARAKGAAAQIRYRQKAGEIRAAGTAEFALEMVRKNRQVAISCEYLGAVHKIEEHLRSRNVTPAIFTGENRDERESHRLAFQQGRAPVIIFTPAEGFSLHAGEESSRATLTPRVTIVAQPRWSPKKALQIEGRGQRNGQSAPCYYPFAAGTAEANVIRAMIHGMKDTGTINGDDTQAFVGLAEALDVPFVAP